MRYSEDLAIEKRPKMRCNWASKSPSYFLPVPYTDTQGERTIHVGLFPKEAALERLFSELRAEPHHAKRVREHGPDTLRDRQDHYSSLADKWIVFDNGAQVSTVSRVQNERR